MRNPERQHAPDGATFPFATLDDIYNCARDRLPPDVWNHLAGGAGDEVTVRMNRSAFEQWNLLPRVLAGNGIPRMETTFAGIDLALPIVTAPFGSDRLFHPDGHLAVARANRRAGIASIVSGAGSFSLEAVRGAAPEAARMFQLHSVGSERVFRDLAARAIDCGYTALCVTADCPTRGWRERMRRDSFTIDVDAMKGNYPAVASETLGQLEHFDQPVWSWEKLGRLCSELTVPFVVKGILTGADAERAIKIGASGVLVSNHGGRQLDGVPAALSQLPEVVDAVEGRIEVGLDGGVRRGTDVLKALCLGARVVVLGRAVAMALAADGESAVFQLLSLIRSELETSMVLLGCDNVDSLGRSYLQPRSTALTGTAQADAGRAA